MVLAWAAALFLATRFFGQWEDSQRNPNRQVQSEHGQGFIEVRLLSNGQGHFVVDGAINGQVVHFMLDTGATDVAIPEGLARDLNLARGSPVLLSTANGRTEGYRTRWPACNWATSTCRTYAPLSCRAWMAPPCYWA